MKVIVSVLGNLGTSVVGKDIVHINTNDLFIENPEHWAKNFVDKIDEFLDKRNFRHKILFVDSYIETLEILKRNGYKFLLICPGSATKSKWFQKIINSYSESDIELTEDEVKMLYEQAVEFEYSDRQLMNIPEIKDIEWVIRNMILSNRAQIVNHDFSWIVYTK